MDEDFEIPVVWKDSEISFPARLLVTGYTSRIQVDVNDVQVLYERDDEGAWRALVSPEDLEANKKIDVRLIAAIAGSIEKILE